MEAPETEPAGTLEIQGGNERILFVDDEPELADMMQKRLEGLGYGVTAFTSGIDALEFFKNCPEDVDLIITDLTMPVMTGIELTRELLGLRPDLPVILCTGFSESVDESRAKAFGIREYLDKPVDKPSLAKAIRRALDGSS